MKNRKDRKYIKEYSQKFSKTDKNICKSLSNADSKAQNRRCWHNPHNPWYAKFLKTIVGFLRIDTGIFLKIIPLSSINCKGKAETSRFKRLQKHIKKSQYAESNWILIPTTVVGGKIIVISIRHLETWTLTKYDIKELLFLFVPFSFDNNLWLCYKKVYLWR